MPQTFEGVVIQIDMGQVYLALLQRIRIDGEVMVVRGDLDLAVVRLLYRMIAAMVAELQLVTPAPKRETDQLVAETDTEDRLLAYQPPDVVLRVVQRLRVSWPIGKEDAIRLERQHIFGRDLRRHHCDPGAFARKHS